MLSAFWMVDRRWATMMDVLPLLAWSSASCTTWSDRSMCQVKYWSTRWQQWKLFENLNGKCFIWGHIYVLSVHSPEGPVLTKCTTCRLDRQKTHEGQRLTFSLSVSRAEVASSSSSNLGFRKMARAMATRCFCPPESCVPLSPAWVLYCCSCSRRHKDKTIHLSLLKKPVCYNTHCYKVTLGQSNNK